MRIRQRERARDMEELAEEKEAEARRLRSCFVERLQAQAARAEAAVQREQLLRQKLQADFEYNLRLVEERDAELARYEAAVAELRQAVNLLTAENSELKVCLADRDAELCREREERQEFVAGLQAEVDERRRAHWEEVERERRRCEKVRRELETRLREIEGEAERARVEVTAKFEEEAQRTQQQHRTQVEALEAAVMEAQSQVKARGRELDQVKQRHLAAEADKKGLEERVGELQREKRAQEWAWQDRLAAMETDTGKIRGELEQSLSRLTTAHSHLQHKCCELDGQAREKAQCLQMAKECWAERETELERRLLELQAQVEWKEKERTEQIEHKIEELRERDAEIERLQREVAGRREKDREKEGQLEELSHRLSVLRKEREELESSLTSVRSALVKAGQTARAKEEKEEVMEREWRERVKEAERRTSARCQKSLRSISQDRDKLSSELKNLKEELSRQQKTIDCVTKERDVAIATLNTHNLYQSYTESLTEAKVDGRSSHDMLSREMLSQQNEQLRSAISSMRRELEQLSGGRGYVAHLETELVKVNTENRRLRGEGRPPSGSHQGLGLGEVMVALQREKGVAEEKVEKLRRSLLATEASLRERQEEVFQLRALAVPPVKCQEKLLQATRSILSLLREREYLMTSLRTLQNIQKCGGQPHTEVKTGGQPHTEVKTGGQPHTEVKTGGQPLNEVKSGTQAQTEVKKPQPEEPSPSSPAAPLPPVNMSPSSLQFSDSEVEGRKSLDRLMENCLSSSPPPEALPQQSTVAPSSSGEVAMTMLGQNVKLIERKPHIRQRSHRTLSDHMTLT